MNELLFSWKFSDNKNRSNFWYILAASIALGLIIWGFFTSQYGMSFIILLISGIYLFVENNSNDEIEIQILSWGIKVENALYDYGSISSYTVVYYHELPYFLRLHLNKKGIRQLDVRIDEDILSQIQPILGDVLEINDSQNLTFWEKMIIRLKL